MSRDVGIIRCVKIVKFKLNNRSIGHHIEALQHSFIVAGHGCHICMLPHFLGIYLEFFVCLLRNLCELCELCELRELFRVALNCIDTVAAF